MLCRELELDEFWGQRLGVNRKSLPSQKRGDALGQGSVWTREELLMKLGAARNQFCKGWRLVVVEVAADNAAFTYRSDRAKLRQARSREGRYLLRTNMAEEDPTRLLSHYLLLVIIEEAFKTLRGDLAIRPIFHQLEARIEAHVFIAFLAYCLHVTLGRRLHALAPGLTPLAASTSAAAPAPAARCAAYP